MENHQSLIFFTKYLQKNNFRSALLSSVKNKKKEIFFSELTTPDTFFFEPIYF